MEKNNLKEKLSQGDDSQEITREKIKKWLTHDLGAAISCLNAIQSDPDLLDAMVTFMFGRFKNEQQRKEAEKAQLKLEV